MHPEQERFLSLHATGAPVMKQAWLFGESMLRATNQRGVTATISREHLNEMVQLGYFEGFELTETGHLVASAMLAGPSRYDRFLGGAARELAGGTFAVGLFVALMYVLPVTPLAQ